MTLMSYQTQAAPELKQPALLAASKLVSTMVRCCVCALMQFAGALPVAAQKREELLDVLTDAVQVCPALIWAINHLPHHARTG